MYLSARKKVLFVTIGVLMLVGLGFFGWQYKSGKLLSKADTVTGSGTFSDVSSDFWAVNYIQAASLAGIVKGYGDGTFKPDVIVTRDQMAVFIARAVAGGDDKVPTPGGPVKPTAYPDVSSSHWAYKYILYIKSKGIAQGYSDGKFHPEYQVSRDQMSVFLARAIAGSDSAVPAGPATATFKDVPTSFWAYKYVEYLAVNNIVEGYNDGNYKPSEKLNRAQMAVFISRGWDLIGSVLVANVSGKLTDVLGKPMANMLVIADDGNMAIADANGNYYLSEMDATTYQFHFFKDGVEYTLANDLNQMVSINYGTQSINFQGLRKR